MKAHNLLHDKEGSSEYLQAHTATFEDRFFFEIVERRGYQGFGAPNAPIRLAAQSRQVKGSIAAVSGHQLAGFQALGEQA